MSFWHWERKIHTGFHFNRLLWHHKGKIGKGWPCPRTILSMQRMRPLERPWRSLDPEDGFLLWKFGAKFQRWSKKQNNLPQKMTIPHVCTQKQEGLGIRGWLFTSLSPSLTRRSCYLDSDLVQVLQHAHHASRSYWPSQPQFNQNQKQYYQIPNFYFN